MKPVLVLEGLHARVADAEVLTGVELSIRRGEMVAVLGAPGSGVDALANVLLGDPAYDVTAGRILLGDEDVTLLAPDARGKLGMFLAFPHPAALPRVSIYELLRQASSARTGREVSAVEIRAQVRIWRDLLGLSPGSYERHLAEACSPCERAENEVL